jgi:hypothetical protein
MIMLNPDVWFYRRGLRLAHRYKDKKIRYSLFVAVFHPAGIPLVGLRIFAIG